MREKELRLADLRLDNNLKQKDIAKILKVAEDTYSKWERGINDISLKSIYILANFYNVSIDYLIGASDENIIIINKEINYKKLSNRLKELRKEANVSQSQLAEYIGFHQRTYAHYENGTRIPTVNKLYFISSYYGVSIDYLLGRTDTK